MCLIEHLLEESPRVDGMRRLHPEIGSVSAAEHLEAHLRERLAHQFGVTHVVGYRVAHLALAFRRIDCSGGALRYVARSIELCRLAALPKMVERYALLAVERHGCHLLRHYCVATAHAGEACRLRVAAKLDGALLCAAYLVDRVRYVVVLDVRLVGCIVEDERVVSQRILHPLLQFCLREHGSRRVVRVAEVNHVYAMVGNLRYEAVLSGAWQIVAYTVVKIFLFDKAYAFSSLPTLAIQTVVGIVVAAVFIVVFDKTKITAKLKKMVG